MIGRKVKFQLMMGLSAMCAVSWLALPGVDVWAQSENLINRISNDRMAAYEEKLTRTINRAMQRYIHSGRYVLAVKVVWNPEVVPLIENPEVTPDRQKLPGFPIFVRSMEASANEDDSAPPFNRLEVKVLLDETLPEYYERFARKLVPIVARFDFNRGDQVVVLKETFPVLPQDVEPPTLPEQELMEQLGQAPPPGQRPMAQPVPAPGSYAMPQQFQPRQQPGQPRAVSPVQAAQTAYDEGRYNQALQLVQGAFQQATTPRERGYFLGMEGSIYFTMGNVQSARASWQRAVTFDPGNLEVQQAMNYLETQQQQQQPTGEQQ